jgi:hypothetical protein
MAIAIHALDVGVVVALLGGVSRSLAGIAAFSGAKQQACTCTDTRSSASTKCGTCDSAHCGAECGTTYAAISGSIAGRRTKLAGCILPTYVIV